MSTWPESRAWIVAASSSNRRIVGQGEEQEEDLHQERCVASELDEANGQGARDGEA
jgi:hypothetical protein